MATIYDVAKVAGVSAKTVSRVLNGDGPVGRETREAVEAAMRDLGYVPSNAARMMLKEIMRELLPYLGEYELDIGRAKRASHQTSACSTAHGITSRRNRWLPSPWRAARLIDTQPSTKGLQAGTRPARTASHSASSEAAAGSSAASSASGHRGSDA